MRPAVIPSSPLSLPRQATPLIDIPLMVAGVPRLLRLKAEWSNPCGSIKDRTATALLATVVDRLDPRAGVIESTSGNLGLALAAGCAELGVPFTAVVDPRASNWLVNRMHDLGAIIVHSDVADQAGGYLLSRIATVRAMCLENPGLVWTNQYENEANPRAHERTGAELAAQAPRVQAIFVPVSTGGTLAGIQRYGAQQGLAWRAIGVDVHGSVALGGIPGPRVLSGIGASHRSYFFPTAGVSDVERTSTEDAIACCDWAGQALGLSLGASAGAALAAALRRMRSNPELREAACICPDGADRYQETVYDIGWRKFHDIRPERAWAELGTGVSTRTT
ncbi:MAG: pyridoxal-phosphate dependent enzyme [Jatrophihabitantaceae bacterium]